MRAAVMAAEKLLRFSAQNNTDFRIFPFFYIFYSLIFLQGNPAMGSIPLLEK